jgi:CRP-like cAMP-binding protein
MIAWRRDNLTRVQRFALGMALLRRRNISGIILSHEDIAAWCGCSKSTVFRIERQALKKARKILSDSATLPGDSEQSHGQ